MISFTFGWRFMIIPIIRTMAATSAITMMILFAMSQHVPADVAS